MVQNTKPGQPNSRSDLGVSLNAKEMRSNPGTEWKYQHWIEFQSMSVKLQHSKLSQFLWNVQTWGGITCVLHLSRASYFFFYWDTIVLINLTYDLKCDPMIIFRPLLENIYRTQVESSSKLILQIKLWIGLDVVFLRIILPFRIFSGLYSQMSFHRLLSPPRCHIIIKDCLAIDNICNFKDHMYSLHRLLCSWDSPGGDRNHRQQLRVGEVGTIDYRGVGVHVVFVDICGDFWW